MHRLAALACSALIAGCFPTIAEIRSGEPAMRASFTMPAENVTACLSQAWESVRLGGGRGPLRVNARFIAGTGTIVIEVPKADGIPWLIEVARAPGEGASVTAWSRRTTVLDSQPAFAEVMRRAVAACGGAMIEDRFERDARRGLAHAP